MGRVNTDLHDALKAQEFYLKALEIGEKTKDYHLLAKDTTCHIFVNKNMCFVIMRNLSLSKISILTFSKTNLI